LLDSLGPSQRQAFFFVAEKATEGSLTLTQAAQCASDFGIASEPSARRLIQKLRDLGIVDCGRRGEEGVILSLTPLGFVLLNSSSGSSESVFEKKVLEV
jgi:hypothetical protein